MAIRRTQRSWKRHECTCAHHRLLPVEEELVPRVGVVEEYTGKMHASRHALMQRRSQGVDSPRQTGPLIS